MGIWNELMYLVMMLFALTSNLSIAATSICLVLGAIVVVAQRICTGSLPDMDKGLVKMVALYCVLQVVAALMAPDVSESLEEVWGIVYRISPLFMGIGYLQTRRRMAWILVAFAVSVFVGDALGAYQLVAWDEFSPTGASSQSAFYATHLLMALPIFYLMCKQDEGVLAAKTVPVFLLVFSLIMYAVVSWGDWNAIATPEMIWTQSSFAKIFMQTGLVGLLSFLLLQGYVLYRLVRLYQAEKSISHSVNTASYGMIGIWILAGIHLEGLLESSILQISIMREYWLLMGLLLAAGKMKLLEAGKVEA